MGKMRAEEGWKRTLWPHAGEAGNVQVRRQKNILRNGWRSVAPESQGGDLEKY